MFPPHPQSFCALPSSLFCMVLSLLRHLPLGSVCSIAATPWGPPLGLQQGKPLPPGTAEGGRASSKAGCTKGSWRGIQVVGTSSFR